MLALEKQTVRLEDRCRIQKRELCELRDAADEATSLRSERDSMERDISQSELFSSNVPPSPSIFIKRRRLLLGLQ